MAAQMLRKNPEIVVLLIVAFNCESSSAMLPEGHVEVDSDEKGAS
jgi:hypothetical protein